ncbi:MAG: hypothetical protein QXE96_07290 [Candidatus Caldarchaeum sp.]
MTCSDKSKIYEAALAYLSRSLEGDVQGFVSSNTFSIEEVKTEVNRVLAETNPSSAKISLAIEAIASGSDPQVVARFLSWREMENFVAEACRRAGFTCRTGYRLSVEGRRAEIDVLAAGSSICLAVDCKRWNKRLAGKTLRKIVEKSLERTSLLKKYLAKRFGGDHLVFLAPVVVSLYEPSQRVVSDVFVVPVHSLRGFLASVENVLAGAVYSAYLRPDWATWLERDNLNQSLERCR